MNTNQTEKNRQEIKTEVEKAIREIIHYKRKNVFYDVELAEMIGDRIGVDIMDVLYTIDNVYRVVDEGGDVIVVCDNCESRLCEPRWMIIEGEGIWVECAETFPSGLIVIDLKNGTAVYNDRNEIIALIEKYDKYAARFVRKLWNI